MHKLKELSWRQGLAKYNFSKKLFDKNRNLSENVTTIISPTTPSLEKEANHVLYIGGGYACIVGSNLTL